MFAIEDTPTRSPQGLLGINCPFCKSAVFGNKGIEVDGIARLEWHCVRCHAAFTSLPPFEEAGESRESIKEKIIDILLSEGTCEAIVRIYADKKRPPVFIENELRNLIASV